LFHVGIVELITLLLEISTIKKAQQYHQIFKLILFMCPCQNRQHENQIPLACFCFPLFRPDYNAFPIPRDGCSWMKTRAAVCRGIKNNLGENNSINRHERLKYKMYGHATMQVRVCVIGASGVELRRPIVLRLVQIKRAISGPEH
jgi:hypothetical protein